MNKLNEISKTQKDEEKILIANVMDKIKAVKERSGFKSTVFLNMAQSYEIDNILKTKHFENYEFFGGFEDAERKMLIVYSDEMYAYLKSRNEIYDQVMSVIKVTLPKGQKEEYTHKTYLGALMKLGLKREMIGDIIVKNNGAEIIIAKEIEKFLLNDLRLLTRFQKAKIEKIELEDISYVKPETKITRINIPAMRLDAIVAEIIHSSRNEAQKVIDEERVFINFKEEISYSKKIEENDTITVRGKGRFKILKIAGTTKSGRLNVEVETFS